MRLAIGVFALACAAWAGTVDELIDSVRGGLQAKRPDAEIAAIINQAGLTERLDDAAIEALESDGVGPQTIEALERQRELSQTLPSPHEPLKFFDAPPAPADADQKRVLGAALQIAMRYTADLPNFICTETISRYSDAHKTQFWKLRDTLTVDVAFSEKGERYRLVAVNHKPTTKNLSHAGGFHSNGEFGSILQQVFGPESATAFSWERWTMLRSRLMYVFSYRIDQPHSKYTLNLGSFFKHYKATTGMKGLVFIDRETNRVFRLSAEADGLPRDWPVLRTSGVLDYEFADVNGQKFLLPRRVDTRVILKAEQVRNVTEFADYRRFSSEATITFEK